MSKALLTHLEMKHTYLVLLSLPLVDLYPSQKLPKEDLKKAPVFRVQRPKKEAGHSRLVGESFNKQGQLTQEACLRRQQDEWIPTPALQILKACRGPCWVQSLPPCRCGQHPITTSRLCPRSSLCE